MNLNSSKLLLLTLSLFSSAHADTKLKYGPTHKPLATELALSNEYFRSSKNVAPDFWAMIGFYVPETFGSPAALATVLNAAKAREPKTADDKVMTEKELLETIDVEHWKERASEKGFNGVKGVTLDQLGKISEAVFKKYGFQKATVTVMHVDDTSPENRKKVISALKKNEQSANDFIIANFNQKSFTDDADTGHIAPVGAFDASKNAVLILDQDREYYSPYWVSLDTFVSGMATIDSASKTSRGLIWIQTR